MGKALKTLTIDGLSGLTLDELMRLTLGPEATGEPRFVAAYQCVLTELRGETPRLASGESVDVAAYVVGQVAQTIAAWEAVLERGKE